MNFGKLQVTVKKSDSKAEPCKGLVFRCEITSWVGGKGDVNFRERYHFIKSKSCPGCDQCGIMKDELQDFTTDPKCYNIIHEGQHGKLYTVRVTNISTDWETGFVDDWDLEFIEYKELEECTTQNKC